jgi:uncharacterized protein (DUF302 family)
MKSSMEISAVSPKSFDETVNAVEQLSAEHGFRVLHVHDIQAALKEKGFVLPPYKIIEICNAKYSQKILMTDRRIGLVLPCKINVFIDDQDNVVVSGLRPTIIRDLYPAADVGTIPQDVEVVVQSIIERAVHQ